MWNPNDEAEMLRNANPQNENVLEELVTKLNEKVVADSKKGYPFAPVPYCEDDYKSGLGGIFSNTKKFKKNFHPKPKKPTMTFSVPLSIYEKWQEMKKRK